MPRAVESCQPDFHITGVERLKSHADFTTVLRCHHKFSQADIVLHYLLRPERPMRRTYDNIPEDARRVGFAVSKAVGNAVQRNRVKRRLRVLTREFEEVLPPSCDLVIRAKPGAAKASFQSLQEQVLTLFRMVDCKAKTFAKSQK